MTANSAPVRKDATEANHGSGPNAVGDDKVILSWYVLGVPGFRNIEYVVRSFAHIVEKCRIRLNHLLGIDTQLPDELRHHRQSVQRFENVSGGGSPCGTVTFSCRSTRSSSPHVAGKGKTVNVLIGKRVRTGSQGEILK